MVESPLFVSCDIVGHSGEPDIDVQLRRASGLNDVVRAAIDRAPADQIFWFSGGDGGHVAFTNGTAPDAAVTLMLELRAWAVQADVQLRVTACSGRVQRFKGAD